MPNFRDPSNWNTRSLIAIMSATLSKSRSHPRQAILCITEDGKLSPESVSNPLVASLVTLPVKSYSLKKKTFESHYDEVRHTKPGDTTQSFRTRPLLIDIRLRMRRQKYK